MKKQPFYILFLLLIIGKLSLQAASTDSLAARKSLFIIPHASYQQETSVAPGIAYGYYFKSNDISRISSISGSAVYTFRNQFLFNISPKIFLNNKKWYLFSNFNFRNYPDDFFGIGNKPTTLKQPITSQNISVLLQPQYILSKHFFIGATLMERYERTICHASSEIKDSLTQLYGKAGWEPYNQLHLGIVSAYDTRDNQFYPLKGTFAKLTIAGSVAEIGSKYSLVDYSFDIRQYVSLFSSHVLACQFYSAGIVGKQGIPFQLLPTLGGRDFLRGYRQGMYRENLVFLLQTEYRLPIYKRLKAAIFCSAGDVVNSDNATISKLKMAYGAGLRYRLNDARVHLRFDLAKNNYGEKLQFYITATEAF